MILQKFIPLLLGLWLIPGQAFAEEKKGKAPEIRLIEKNWGEANSADILAVLRSTARQLFPHSGRDDWNSIHVGRSSKGPIVLFRRGNQGQYFVNLNTGNRLWAQYAFQFSHEIGHILCGYREGDQSNHWFEETLCETASLFTLAKLSEDWKTNAPYSNWKSYANAFKKYAGERIEKHPWPEDLSMADWFEKEKEDLAKNATNRGRNLMVAIRLLPFFEADPTGWTAVSALNTKKDKKKRSFETYLRDWREECQTDEHRAFVDKIAKAFGFDL
jgi:hypothetical protein